MRTAELFSSLEPRQLMAIDVAGVGFSDRDDGPGTAVFVSTGVVADDGTFTGVSQTGAGTESLGPIDLVPFGQGGFLAVSGEDSYAYQTGSYYAPEFGAGFFYGVDAASDPFNAEDQFSIWIPRANSNISTSALDGTWWVSLLSFDAQNAQPGRAQALFGTLVVGGGSVTLNTTTTDDDSGFQGTFPLVSSGDRGQFSVAGTGTAHVSDNQNVMVGAFSTAFDASRIIFVAMRQNTAIDPAAASGRYRVGLGFGSTYVGEQGANENPALLAVVDLRSDGTWYGWDAEDHDILGDTLAPQSSGTWSVKASGVIAFADAQSGQIYRAVLSPGSAPVLMPYFVSGGEVGAANVFGIGTRVSRAPGDAAGPSDPVLANAVDVALPEFDSTGAYVFELNETGTDWKRTALYEGTTPPANIRQVERFFDRGESRDKVLVVADGALDLFAHNPYTGAWERTDLLAATGATALSSNAATFSSYSRAQDPSDDFVAGVDVNGDVVLYAIDERGRVTFTNLTDTFLAPNNVTPPPFVGNVVSYVTGWNGLNFVGLDADGQLWTVWTAPGLNGWTANNLTQLTGAPELVGGISAFVTQWDSINIVGVDAGGNILTTWWLPGGQWRTDNLTALTGGPQVRTTGLTSYVSDWGGLNIAAFDQSGELTVYWWAPGLTDWQIAPLTAGLPATGRPVQDLSAYINEEDQFNIYGEAEDGDTIRVYWQPGAASWTVENVTDAV